MFINFLFINEQTKQLIHSKNATLYIFPIYLFDSHPTVVTGWQVITSVYFSLY